MCNIRRIVTVVCFALFEIFLSSAQADLVITVREVGADVVLRGAGAINTADLTLATTAASWITPSINNESIRVGTGNADGYTGFSGPSTFGPGPGSQFAIGTGDPFGITTFNDRLFVPRDYVSGTALLGVATVSNNTLVGLGLSEGIYSYSWGSGPTADSLTIDISAVPEPSAFLYGGLISVLVGCGYGVKRRMG